jgi:hypothetical protein
MEIKTMETINPVEGFGELCVSLHTPAIMRDCIRERYWDNPNAAEIFKGAIRLADDFKRRGFAQQKAVEIILEHLVAKLRLVKTEALKNIASAVTWVYAKQEHGITCAGALNREGLCFRTERACRFQEIDSTNRQAIRNANPIILPAEVSTYLEAAHPSEAIYARWTYTELLYLEQERNLIPGDLREPIFIGFRALAMRVSMRNKTPGYNKHEACKAIKLLEDCKLVKRVVHGKAGYMQRMANGYARITPISRKYNSESEITD